MKDVLELLRNDHVAVRGLLADLEQRASHLSMRQKLEFLNLIEREVKIHTAVEEKIVYPAFRRAGDQDRDRALFREAIAEHHAVDELFPGLKVFLASERAFDERLREVRHAVEEHVRMEEQELFPRARELLGPEGLGVLAERVTREKQRLFESWSGGVGRTLRRAKSLVDKLVPLAVKRGAIAARSAAPGADPRR